MTKLDEFKARAEAVGGAAWSEEIIIRGRPDGTVGGRAYRIGWTAPGVTGAMVGGVEGPYELPTEGENAEWSQVAADINAAALNTIAVREAQIGEMTQLLQSQGAEIERLTRELAAAAVRIQELVAEAA